MVSRKTDARMIALIRGINVGRAKRIAMAELRDLLARIGFEDVCTLLNSGNVVFTDPGHRSGDAAARIEKAIASRLGVRAAVTVLTAEELAAAMAHNPLEAVAINPSRMLVAVPRDAPAARRLKPMTRQDWSPEAFALGRRVAYLWCPGGVIASRVAKEIDRILGEAITSRNWSTMTRLCELAGGFRRDHGGVSIMRAGAVYFAVVFAAGFALGVIRVVWIVPRAGERAAEVAEAPLMVLVSFLAARWVVRRLAHDASGLRLVRIGLVALGLLLAFEIAVVVWVRGLSLGAYLAARDPAAFASYVASVALFAVMPWLVGRRRA